MAISGPAPKEDPVRRNAPTHNKVQFEWDGLERGPELPYIEQVDEFGMIQVFEWNTRTVEWWNKWRNSAQAMVMQDSDWEGMLETAMLHTRFWNGNLKPNEMTTIAAALKQRVAAYGATYEDRLKLRMVIKNDQDEANEEVQIQQEASKMIDYASRLLGAVAKEKE